MSVSYGGDSITFADSSTISSGWTGFKNRVINGDMRINQRGNTSYAISTDPVYTLDRWRNSNGSSGTGGVFTFTPSTDAPPGFIASNKFTVTTANSSPSTYYAVNQILEGNNVTDLKWGTTDAVAATLSFWVKSSITGTFGFSLIKAGGGYSFAKSYTINQSNTWEYKTITIPGAGTGTGSWASDNTAWGYLIWSLGSNRTGTTDSWVSGVVDQAAGSTNLISTAGATWQFTGVQFERGSTASSFEYRPYTTELQLCQRYFYTYSPSTFVDYSHPITNDNTTSYRTMTVYFPVFMRSAPTLSSITVSGTATTAPSATAANIPGAYFQWNSVSSGSFLGLSGFFASAEL